LADGRVRFGFEHTSRGSFVGPAIKIDPDAEHRVIVQMSSLYPPVEHPLFDRLSEDLKRARRELVQVKIDGCTALSFRSECYDATEREPSIGTSGARPAFKRDFSGRLLAWRRLTRLEPERVTIGGGPLHLMLRLPAFHGRKSEPLLCLGETGRGDLVYIMYEDARHFRIGHDHWGIGFEQSGPIEMSEGRTMVMELVCPPLLGPNAPPRIEVKIDGKLAWSTAAQFYPSRVEQWVVGANPIGASTAAARFTGDIMPVGRTPSSLGESTSWVWE